jgi:predicted glycoside hydrolase/deacetylase ChbG (UPF0249 family)
MKKIILTFLSLVLLITNYSCAQKDDIYLIVRADDIGFTHSANKACIDSYIKGIARSVEIMVPTPWFEEAVTMLNEHPEYDVGIHLTLTSEWSNLKWRPLTNAPSITDDNGYFHPFVWKNDVEGATFLLENDWKIEEIAAELRAQIELAKSKLPHLSHYTGHMGFAGADPKIQEVVEKLADEYGINIDTRSYGVKRPPKGFGGSTTTADEKIKNFIEMLEELTPGIWMFVDHPGYDTDELRGVGHVGYEHVASDRDGVTKAFTSPEVMEVIKKRGIKLISYKDLKEL